MAKSKFFRIAQEGDTTDGRKIERSWLTQMAEGYNPAKYAARIWLEHLRSLLPDSPFRAYGDVLALKTEEIDGKLTLLAQIDPTPDLVSMNKARQKLFTSMEVDTNFARLGEAYLVGLAVTDSPASLGTEMLAFAAGAQANPLADRKLSPDNVFTAAQPITLEFEDESMTTATKPNEEKTLLSKVKALLSAQPEETKGPAGDADTVAAVEALAGAHGKFATEQTAAVAGLQKALDEAVAKHAATDKAHTELKAAHDKLAADFSALKEALDKEPAGGQQRPAATGGNGESKADC